MDRRISIETAIMPFKVKELVEIIMEKKKISFSDAFFYLYTTNCYLLLQKESTKLWYMSGLGLFDMIEEEKKASECIDSKILLFYSFCIENYKNKYQLRPDTALNLFMQKGVFEFLKENFDALHSQGEEYILMEIHEFINKNGLSLNRNAQARHKQL
jgi:hypothetical protein